MLMVVVGGDSGDDAVGGGGVSVRGLDGPIFSLAETGQVYLKVGYRDYLKFYSSKLRVIGYVQFSLLTVLKFYRRSIR
jgi:hypothetical protein